MTICDSFAGEFVAAVKSIPSGNDFKSAARQANVDAHVQRHPEKGALQG